MREEVLSLGLGKGRMLTLFAAPLIGMALLLWLGTSTAQTQTPSPPAQTTYEVKDLGTLGGYYASPYDINDSGQVVGTSRTSQNSSGDRAFLHDGQQMRDLGTLGGYYSHGLGINDSGEVVGFSDNSSGYKRGFLYDGQQMKELPTFGGDESYAGGIDDSGRVVGYAQLSSGWTRAVLYDGQQMKDLGTLGGDESHSGAGDINGSGQIIGAYNDSFGDQRAFLYDGQQMRDLGTLGGGWSYAESINDAGQVVGYAQSSISGGQRAFLYDGQQMKDLGALGSDESSIYLDSAAYDINDSGQVVGWSYNSSGSQRAFLHDGQQMKDLNDLLPDDSGWFIDLALAINNNGQIAARGFNIDAGGSERVILLTPTETKPTIKASLDIKPLSCPNPLITSNTGSLPVAILGTSDLDVSQIDTAKPIKLEGVSAQVPSKGAIKDVATPFSGTITDPPQSGQCTKAGADGKRDLNLKFDAQQVTKALGEVTNKQARVLELTAYLKDGTYLSGQDVVVTNIKSN